MSDYPPYYAYPSAPPLVRVRPSPPRLHWGWVLALNIVTLGFFGIVWLLVQANWARKMRGKSSAFVWAIVYAAFFPGFIVFMFAAGLVLGATGHASEVNSLVEVVQGVVRLGTLVLYLGTAYSLRSELENDPIGIPLGGGMTFFFAPVYFQYHLFDYEQAGAGGSAKSSGITSLSLSGAAPIVNESEAPAESPAPSGF